MKYYVVDTFTNEVFRGNQAGVCLLDREISDEVMQSIASENNLSETAFFIEKVGVNYLRWFTPDVEIDLCGHATLATAYVIMTQIKPDMTKISFQTMSGELTVEKQGDLFTMYFPTRAPKAVETPALLEQALGCKIIETTLSRDMVALVESEEFVKNMQPDIELMKQISKDIAFAVVVTAKGESCDFVSRFFAPNAGIVEDPVTGSSHCTLIPYWKDKLQKTDLYAKQLSKRGGILQCKYLGDTVAISGEARLYMQGEIFV